VHQPYRPAVPSRWLRWRLAPRLVPSPPAPAPWPPRPHARPTGATRTAVNSQELQHTISICISISISTSSSSISMLLASGPHASLDRRGSYCGDRRAGKRSSGCVALVSLASAIGHHWHLLMVDTNAPTTRPPHTATHLISQSSEGRLPLPRQLQAKRLDLCRNLTLIMELPPKYQ
jgi:hypothetical protein